VLLLLLLVLVLLLVSGNATGGCWENNNVDQDFTTTAELQQEAQLTYMSLYRRQTLR
jgi:hypothetical protein